MIHRTLPRRSLQLKALRSQNTEIVQETVQLRTKFRHSLNLLKTYQTNMLHSAPAPAKELEAPAEAEAAAPLQLEAPAEAAAPEEAEEEFDPAAPDTPRTARSKTMERLRQNNVKAAWNAKNSQREKTNGF